VQIDRETSPLAQYHCVSAASIVASQFCQRMPLRLRRWRKEWSLSTS